MTTNPFENYWVKVEGGTFMMGCTAEQAPCDSNELPIHPVTLSTFFIGKTEVTQGQWLAVTGNNPSEFYHCGLDCPVETVSWNRIVNEFIPALNRKTGREHALPTEAEWEFAARGGNLSKGYRYAGSNALDSVAWYYTGSIDTHPVGEKEPNELGLYDMSGNVWEWCNDCYDAAYYSNSPLSNPPGPGMGNFRALRGGSFYNSNVDFFRPAHRAPSIPDFRDSGGGFRVARH